jgi:hypothetical protein
MTQQRITFEWVLEDSRADFWRALENEASGRDLDRVEQRVATFVLRGLALLFVMVAAAAGAAMTPGERERREAERGIAFTLDLENKAWAHRDRGLYHSLIDPYLAEDWQDAWQDYWRAGTDVEPDFHATLLHVREVDGYMQATVLTEQPAFEWWQTNPYREERFYRRVDRRWMRTVPPASHWGDMRELHTAHLHFIYYDLDAAAVAEAAPKLEAAFVGMYRTLGVETLPATKQVISVVPNPIGRWSATSTHYRVTSPLLSQIPAGQSEGEYLAYEVMGWFTYQAMRDATPNAGVRYLYRWPILVWGLRGWLRDDLINQPSPWHEEALRVLHQEADTFLPVSLLNITDLRTNARPTREEVILRYLSAESFMHFIVEYYGRDRLPDLLAAMVRYSSWEEIIPRVYGDNVAQFEAAWNEHLIQKYGLGDRIQ